MVSTLTPDETHRSFSLRSWNSLQPAKRTSIAADNGRSEGPSSLPDAARQQHPVSMLLPIMAVVLIAFLIIGFALPVLPLHVHQGLGLSTFVVGLVTGSQFAASLISCVWSGNYADSRGAKRAVVNGLLTATVAGTLYLLSLRFLGERHISVAILLLGRALLGGAESFIITGAVSWGLALVGEKSAGRVIAWMGMAMFAAFALGAPLGTTLYRVGGFAAVAIATTLVPLVTLLLVAPLSPLPPRRADRPALMKVAGAVWLPGLGSALSSIGFGAILAFSALISADRAWDPVWLAFSTFAVALITARAFLGHLPDRIGGARVALVSVLIEAAGLALIWLALGRALAATGAALTGFGYALVYPGLGVEAVLRAPPESRGLAMGAYTAFLDVALGFGTPVLGLIASWVGLGAVFLASSLAVLCGAAVATLLLVASPPGKEQP
jgi:MFS family permease